MIVSYFLAKVAEFTEPAYWIMKRLLKRLRNPHNLTRVHLAKLIRKHGYVIGDYSYGAPRVRTWGEGTNLTIGPYCSIADHVTIFLGGNHRTDWVSTYPFSDFPKLFPGVGNHPSTLFSPGDVTIGADVWIGAGATILPGVTIHPGAVIAAETVVVKDVSPYSVVAGNPGQIVKQRFEDDVISALIESSWWDRPHAEVEKLAPLLLSGRVGDLLQALSQNAS